MSAECANPLLLGWVKEWLDAARDRNTKGFQVYRRAYDSLKSCPLPFDHPSEAQQLHGFGPKLCDRLTAKLQDHCRENGLPMPEMPYKAKKAPEEDGDGVAPVKKTRKAKPYVPTLRSGSYALILALSSLCEDASLGITKTETIELAQPHCDSSFTAPSDPSKFYTAWSSMKTLVDKDLVYEKGRPLRRYALTEEGWEVARRIKKTLEPAEKPIENFVTKDRDKAEDGFAELLSSPERSQPRRLMSEPTQPGITDGITDIIPMGAVISDEASLPTFSPIIVPPSTFTVELVLDVREIRAKEDRDYMSIELTKKGVKPIMRALELGDAQWVAKCHDPHFLSRNGAEGDEVVLDWIVERKRLDDLVGSIKDGRFHEQKFRLRKSGVENVIYIIEEIAMNADHYQKYEEAVESAIASTQVVNGYFLKKTQKMDDSIRYLARMTMLLKNLYESKPLYVIPTRVLTAQNYLPLLTSLRERQPTLKHHVTYAAFASLASKSETLTLRDVHLKMLMCTRGVTGEKALEIQKRWKTPQDLVKAFDGCGSGEEGKKRKLGLVMGEMSHLVGRKKIGKLLSHKIAEVWGDV
ncbi:MAG: Crossover junction endonuclease mus81 [Claussenomyces sp. TS43310]|nr:MAG: Crossover junction endonuclease mus81 [Claussenomyces sp. TS43310]